MGGYIEDVQLSLLGLEIYRDLHGPDTKPKLEFIVPPNDEDWPSHLWGYELGAGVEKHLAHHLKPKVQPKCTLICGGRTAAKTKRASNDS
ncbi:hypothetical protein EON64_15090 [archaeon]|nr:MAG: hypothetical protein EON64_15090 [archaeon]